MTLSSSCLESLAEAAPTPVLSPLTLFRINSAEGPPDAGRGSPARSNLVSVWKPYSGKAPGCFGTRLQGRKPLQSRFCPILGQYGLATHAQSVNTSVGQQPGIVSRQKLSRDGMLPLAAIWKPARAGQRATRRKPTDAPLERIRTLPLNRGYLLGSAMLSSHTTPNRTD